MTMFLDVSVFGGWGGVLAAVTFFLIFLGVAFIAFKMLKKTVKMAVRIAVVGIIIAIAAVGSIILWTFDGSPERPRPRPTSNR